MSNNEQTFEVIMNQAKDLIQENSYREIKPTTKYKRSGIYMIYIDHFTSDKIVPIYLGKSKDIQRRYKQHFTEILALNRLSYSEYHKYFFSNYSSLYEGAFKACKIFKYMIENDCSLQDFHMIVLEEVEEEYLDEKEQEYFQKLLPSFFGFNQLNSFLKQNEFRFSNTQISGTDIRDYLKVLMEDIKGVHTYYEYGFTRFNFEHSLPTDMSFLLKGKEQLDSALILEFNEVKSTLYELHKQNTPDFEVTQRLARQQRSLYEVYQIAKEECKGSLDVLTSAISDKFEDLQIYNENAIENFVNSIKYKNESEYKKSFRKFLKSKKCKLNFYKLFGEQIKDVNKKMEEVKNKYALYQESYDVYIEKEIEKRPEKYKIIFPSCQFDSFSLKDRPVNLSIKENEDKELFNVMYFQIYISNNALNRSLEYRKEPFIIRFDYCYIDKEGSRIEKSHYIDNETTRNSQYGIKYIEKDYYNTWAIRKEKFKISSMINDEIDNSFISVLAEYKHGINDYTLKNKHLLKLSSVLDEVRNIVDEETGFKVGLSESYKCLEFCMINEGLNNDPLADKLISKKLQKPKRRRKPTKKVENKVSETNKVSREEAYKQKVSKRSDGVINVLNYISSKEKVTAKCNSCDYEWKIRSDHLLSKPYCPFCRRKTQ